MAHDLSIPSHQSPLTRVHLFENVVKNNQSGKRKVAHPNGTYYDGMFKNGKLNGFGTIFYPTKTLEEGYFENNCLNGAGRITNTQMTFEGQFKNGCLVEGNIKLSDGTTYAGKFTEDLLNSSLIEESPREEVLSQILFEGRITFPNGTIYENKPKNEEEEPTIDVDDEDTANEDDMSAYSENELILEFGSDFDHVDWKAIAAEMVYGFNDDESDSDESAERSNESTLNAPGGIFESKVLTPAGKNDLQDDVESDSDETIEIVSDLDQIDWARVTEGMGKDWMGYDFQDDISVTSKDEHQSPDEPLNHSNFLATSPHDTVREHLIQDEPLNGFFIRKFYDQTEEGFFVNNQLNGIGKRVFDDGLSIEGLFKNGVLVEGKITLPDGIFFEGNFEDDALNSSLLMNEITLELCKRSMLSGEIHFPKDVDEREDITQRLNNNEVLSETDDQDAFDQLNADLDAISEHGLSNTLRMDEEKSEGDSEYDMLSEFDTSEQQSDLTNKNNPVHGKDGSEDSDDDAWIILSNMELRG